MEPTRCCIACRKRNNKSGMIRIVPDKTGNVVYDREQKVSARALYLCRNIQCLENIKKCINKNKFKSKVYLKTDSFIELIDELKIELGE